jgi:hypothetical protein
MSFDADTLLRLLPAIYRIRDAGQMPPEPLRALFSAFAEEIAAMEENVEQLYDDLFIETCAGWAIPYIGDLVGFETVHSLGRGRGLKRAEVAHEIARRRRKGTVPVLEQLGHDVTGWRAHTVEYFQLLATTQYMNHLRPRNHYAPDLRRWEPLARTGSAFESLAHTVDVRRIEGGRGRFNIPNIGIFLWRLDAYAHTRSPAVRVDDRRWLVSPLGAPLQLYHHPIAEDEITQLAEPINVPEPIGRRTLAARLARYYGTRAAPTADLDNAEPSIILYVNGAEVPRNQIAVCDLRDHAGAWGHVAPSGQYAIDPVLGRIAVADDLPVPEDLQASYRYGFSADIGGGEYARERIADAPATLIVRVPTDHPTIQAALAALGGNGVVEITDSGRYEETFSIAVAADGHVRLRAAAQCWPTIVLGAPLAVTGGTNGECTLDGLRIAGEPVHVPAGGGNELARLRLAHMTLVPGLSLDAEGDPVAPGEPSIVVERANVTLELNYAIVGAVRMERGANLSATDSIIDATEPELVAFIAPDELDPGGAFSLEACTVIGAIVAREMPLVSNSLLFARRLEGATEPAVRAEQRQSGCVRFTYLPFDALTPRRYRCQPNAAEGVSNIAPHFTSLRYGIAAYCQLGRTTPDAIRRGAEDESEMGAFHSLYAPQRETNLQIRLAEYLRVGLNAGIFYAS